MPTNLYFLLDNSQMRVTEFQETKKYSTSNIRIINHCMPADVNLQACIFSTSSTHMFYPQRQLPTWMFS